jgi:choline dehydrogenase-like flavoprotein
VNKEVILAGGSIGSPAVLLYSGIGPKDVLSDAGVDLVSELPGVGQHLQDHFVSEPCSLTPEPATNQPKQSATIKYSTDVDTAGSIYYEDGADKVIPR